MMLSPQRDVSEPPTSNYSGTNCITMSDMRGLGSGHTYTVHFGIVAVYGVVILTAISLNSALCHMYRYGALRKAPLNAMLLSLTTADMVSAIGIIPFIAFSPIVFRDVDQFMADLLCTFAADRFIFWVGNIASVTTIGIICMCRYIAINYSLTVWERLTRTKVVKTAMVAIPWIIALVVKVPSMTAMQFDTCSTKCNRLPGGIDAGINVLATMGLAYFIPVVMLSYILFTSIRTLRRPENRNDSDSTLLKNQKRLAIIVAVLLGTFFVWWAPYTMFTIISAFSDVFSGGDKGYYTGAKVSYYLTLPALLHPIIHPIIIGMKSNDFRRPINDEFNIVLVPRSQSLFPSMAIYSETQA